MNEERLTAYLRLGKRLFDGEITFPGKTLGQRETLDDREGYKLKLIENLKKAREAVVNDHDDWAKLLVDAVRYSKKDNENNITEGRHRQFLPVLTAWLDTEEDRATLLKALKALWTEEKKSAGDRVRAFLDQELEHEKFQKPAERLTPIAYLLMALGHDYPPFRSRKLGFAYKHLGYPKHPSRDDLGEVYDHELDFLDKIKERSHALGYERPRDRLDAQSLVWTLGGNPKKVVTVNNGDSDSLAKRLDGLAEKLLLDPTFFLSKIVWPLLEDKKQIIFQGPPGTGKTYVARELAKCLAGSEDRVRIVQFHPSYAYEDFVQGFRPTTIDEEKKQVVFELRKGPLLQMANQAWSELSERHFLVIDEINRGNLSKILGELYYLLEYRADDDEADDEADEDDDLEMQLQYSDESFAMPPNLYIIGTMNTADRSIALVDAALRRRFYFVEFHPDKEPIKDLLRDWLEREAKKWPDKWPEKMEWLPGVVDVANKKLGEKLGEEGRDAAIGPSYFMKKDGLDQKKLERIWEYNVIPYIEEQLYDQRGRIEQDFALDTLRKEVEGTSASRTEGDSEQVSSDAPGNEEN